MSITLFLWAFFFIAQVNYGESLQPQYIKLISSGGFIVTAGGKPIEQYNNNTPFIPASTIKLVTSLTALEILGPSHRFKTEFYLGKNSLIYIKGYGDPFLTSEYIADIAATLRTLGITTISELVLDDTLFNLSIPGNGNENSKNPYDAPNSALAVNFNALPLWKYDTGSIVSGEVQTPLLPLMQKIGQDLTPGRYRLNVAAYPKQDGISNSLRYTAELFTSLLGAEGIKISGSFRRGRTTNDAELIYTYFSRKTVADLVRDCLKYSNNYIANQLFLRSGAKVFDFPATWQKARQAQLDTLNLKFGLDISNFTAVEGSGLSRQNHMTPSFLISVLEALKPYAALLQEKDVILLKSGTLSEVYAYAGYFRSDSSLDPFVIMLNQQKNTRQELLNLLRKKYMAVRNDTQSATRLPR